MRKEKFIAYLTKEKEKCQEKEQDLIREERKDEANLCKIKENIYDIFKTLYQVAWRETEKNGEDKAKAEEMFLKKAEAVPENWKNAYEKAKEYQDVSKILIEETKLDTVEKIMAEYRRLQEEE